MASLASTITVPEVAKFFNKLAATPYTRNVKPGQVAFINVSTHRGSTNVPKHGVWVQILKPNAYDDAYVHVRSLGNATRGSSTIYTIGQRYVASKTSLHRIDPAKFLAADTDTPTTAFTDYNERAFFLQFKRLVEWYQQQPVCLSNWRTNTFGRSSDKLRQDLARGETRSTFKHWGFDNARSVYNATFRKGIRGDLKNMGLRHSGRLRSISAIASTEDAVAVYNSLRSELSSVGNRFRYTSDKERALLNDLINHMTFDSARFPIQLAGCGHAAQPSDVTNVNHHGSYCPVCLARQVREYGALTRALARDGSTVTMFACNTHTWEDGTVRVYAEPPVIGGYHSNKSTFTKSLPHITGAQPHKRTLKVGYELEFCRGKAPKQSDEWFARDMLKRVRDTFPFLGSQPYCAFERDGSVDFEMVSGYGPMDMHRAGVIALLHGNPYHGQLQSHDGGKCGLHVHLDKPQSLMHATRLVAFWNNPFNERLIRSVARRYGKNTGYAKFKGAMGDMATAAKSYKQQVSYYGKADALRRAINGLSVERYDVCNFTNANTVELRAFRGSMLVDTVIACLEFAYMSWYFARDTTADQLTSDNFLAYISKTEWRHESRYIRKYLWNRGFKVWMPKKQPRVHTVDA